MSCNFLRVQFIEEVNSVVHTVFEVDFTALIFKSSHHFGIYTKVGFS